MEQAPTITHFIIYVYDLKEFLRVMQVTRIDTNNPIYLRLFPSVSASLVIHHRESRGAQQDHSTSFHDPEESES